MNCDPCGSTNASGKFWLNTGTNCGSGALATHSRAAAAREIRPMNARNATTGLLVRLTSSLAIGGSSEKARTNLSCREMGTALWTIAALIALGSCAAAAQPSRATYTNPVLDADFPDPTVIRAPDGYYYGYATQTQRGGKWVNIQLARSTDLVHWRYYGDALPAKPGWAAKTQDFWAPHVQRDGRRYILYFSAKPDTSDDRHGMCLGVATATSPLGPFVDTGRPLLCGAGFVNIDPMAFDDPVTGKHLLYWGSGFQPIRVQELGPDRMSFADGSQPLDLIWPNGEKGAFPRLVEASWLLHHEDHYYLFYSGDNCCGPD